MKNFVLALALFSNSGSYEGMFLAPGVYTQRECNMVKAMMDRDHWAAVAAGNDPLAKLFARSSCIDTNTLPRPTTSGPDEMVK